MELRPVSTSPDGPIKYELDFEDDGGDFAHRGLLGRNSMRASGLASGASKQFRRLVSVAIGTVVVGLLLSFALLSSDLTARKEKLLSFLRSSSDPSAGEINETLYYNWKTTSAFDPVRIDSSDGTSTHGLCAGFPRHLLQDIQPVLKTGHGVLEARVHPQLHAGLSCLDDLLIFSDINETFENRQLVDVIADTPQHLINATEQLEPYRKLRECIASDETADCANAITPKDGWRIDKFKFLPSILRAWEMQPGKKWFVFLEADTYMVWDTVFRLLANFDADEPHYFGSPSPGRNGTWFAYGGAGFILSREAMRRLIGTESTDPANDQRHLGLIEAEWHGLLHDCCGDSILGWALFTRGVELSGLWPMFNPHSPTSIPFTSRYWCQPVLSMHKPDIGDLEGLWKWEWRERKEERPLLYRDLLLSYFTIFFPERKTGWTNAGWGDLGFDGPPGGEHVETVEVATVDGCAAACDQDNECFGWTHNADTCKLVHSIRIGKARYLDAKDSAEETKDQSFVAGWAIHRIKAWTKENTCEHVQWVRPSIQRIF